MRLLAIALAALAAAGSCALAADKPPPEPPKVEAPAPQTPGEIRADLYTRLAASKDADETEGLVKLMFATYGLSGTDTGDLLLERAHKAIVARAYDAAGQILDAAIAFMPGEAEAWTARATLRYLDDDYDGAMADVAQTLKRDPRHLGAMMGMASILTSRDKKAEALDVYRRALTIAPHWATAEKAAETLRAELAGQEL